MGRYTEKRGFALLISMIFVCVFGALVVGVAQMGDVNAQISHNQRKANGAFASAQSGLDVMRFLLTGMTIPGPGTVAPADRLTTVAAGLHDVLQAAGMSNVTATYDGSTLTIQDVALDSQSGQSFNAVIRQISDDTLQMDITGCRDQITRAIRADFDFASTAGAIFDFGLASRGPVALTGNVKILGLNYAAESNVYIESTDEDGAVSMTGNSEIAGDVSIANPDAYVTMAGNPKIGGQSGQEAVENHVFIGVEAPEFPFPDIVPFEQYVENTVDASTTVTGDLTFQNIRILANTNPAFSGNINFNGITFVESPNIVSFTGNITITGLVVADGDPQLPSPSNSLIFQGNLYTFAPSNLPAGEEFDGLRTQIGSFLLGPGFGASFGGNFHTLNGAIASSGVTFFGNAGGTINGSVINYSQDTVTMSGNATIYIDRPQTDGPPAGFEADRELEFNPHSYTEVVL